MEIKNQKTKILQLRKKTNCHSCKKKSKDPFTPFCSKKCANQDLIKWLSDEYQNKINID